MIQSIECACAQTTLEHEKAPCMIRISLMHVILYNEAKIMDVD